MNPPKAADALPPMASAERAELEREAGRRFPSDEAAYRYRIRRIQREAVAAMLAGGAHDANADAAEGLGDADRELADEDHDDADYD